MAAVGHGGGVAAGHSAGPQSGHEVGGGRGTAITAPGSQHRSDTATGRLSAPTPGRSNPSSGVTPGFGRVEQYHNSRAPGALSNSSTA